VAWQSPALGTSLANRRKEIAGHGKAPEQKRDGFHPIERDAKGNYAARRRTCCAMKDFGSCHPLKDVHLSKIQKPSSKSTRNDSKDRVQLPIFLSDSDEASAQKFVGVKGFVENLPEIVAESQMILRRKLAFFG